MSVSCRQQICARRLELTRICDAYSDSSSTKLISIVRKCFFQPLKTCELDITEAFWSMVQFVLHNAHICNLTVLEEIAYIALSRIE